VVPKSLELTGVREYAEGFPVELRVDEDSKRTVIHALTEGGYNCTDVDLQDLLDALCRGPRPMLVLDSGTGTVALRDDLLGNREGA
jgi:hypothetical protein